MPNDLFRPQVSAYVVNIRPWRIARAVRQYLKTSDRFATLFEGFIRELGVAAEELERVRAMLQEVHHDLTLVFRRPEDIAAGRFQQVGKFTPQGPELRFLVNVELLWHKMKVVEEYRCGVGYYHDDQEGRQTIQETLSTNLVNIKSLFDEGRELLLELIASYADDVPLLAWIIEEPDEVALGLGMSAERLLARILGPEGVADAYRKVGEYYLESGWGERAAQVLAAGARLKDAMAKPVAHVELRQHEK
ncbi:MAG: hypothetical protein QHJ34_07570 [bacterium]|jgi:hypothetical protein|nr:hypothetical protein [candidate division KSB1 bacterium]MDH7560078.1 hypothetical protein [bacterium]